MTALSRQRILLGVSGGIAAYKAADLVRRLREAGAEVRVVMTDAAMRFVGPATFQALSGHPVRSSLWDESAEAAMGHIELARWADRIAIAPATADLIARLAGGHADDLLTTLCLASPAPILLAPAMNAQMWHHPATRENLARLAQRGIASIGPGTGAQACGDLGPGRMAEPAEILAALERAVAPGPLAGRRVLVSAGPTFEDIDPVRFLGNRSSGRMGFAIAAAASTAGAAVTLIAGPVHLPTPPRVMRIDVRSAAEMRDAVLSALGAHDVFFAAAAVADWRPAECAARKLKKTGAARELALVPTEDILAEAGRHERRPLLVGFAAETDELERHALAKLEAKRLDLVVANRVGVPGVGFDAEENELLLLWPGGRLALGRAPKAALAARLVELVAERLAAGAGRAEGSAA